MSCTGNQGDAVGAPSPSRAFDAVFARFWPEHQPFPPATPWLAAAVSRMQARQWAIEVGADRDPGVLASDMQAMLHVVGLAMAGGGAYEAVREKKKKKKDPLTDCDWANSQRSCDSLNDSCRSACDEAGMGYMATCVALCDGSTTGESCECIPRAMEPF